MMSSKPVPLAVPSIDTAAPQPSSLAPGRPIRSEFPFFDGVDEDGAPRMWLAYLDSAATTQKPRAVIERVSSFLSREYANVHRGAYGLSAGSSERYEEARGKVARWFGASSERSVVFTRGTTEGTNLLAHCLEDRFEPGDVILLSILEHHSNIVPWQLLAARKGLRVEFFLCDRFARLDIDEFREKVRAVRPKLVALTQVSNAFGTVVPVAEFTAVARQSGALVVIDAAQAAPHQHLRVTEHGADFVVFSGHKVYGPTGIGALYINESIVDSLPPFHGGGGMIQTVTTGGVTFADPPHRFEAGTPAIAEAVGLGAALDFLDAVGIEAVRRHEAELFGWAFEFMRGLPGVTVYGPALGGGHQASIVPFTVDGVHPHDLATFADGRGVHIRAGSHCAMPALTHLELGATARASIGMYSCREDFEALSEAIADARRTFL